MIRINFDDERCSVSWADARSAHHGSRVTLRTDDGRTHTGVLWPWPNSGEGETVDLFSLTTNEDGDSVHIPCDTVSTMEVEVPVPATR